MDENSTSHQKQRCFLEDYLTLQGSDLKGMNKRRDQSLTSELDVSNIHNNSLVLKENTYQIKNANPRKQSTETKINQGNTNNYQNNEMQQDQSNLLVTQNNERTFTGYSSYNIHEAKYKEEDELKEGNQVKKDNQQQGDNARISIDRKDDKKQQARKQRKSINAGNPFNNPQNFQNMSLIPKIKKKLIYFYQMFTSSGRLQFLQQSKVRQQIQDSSEFLTNQSTSFFTMICINCDKFLEFYENTLMKNIPLIDTYGNLSFSLLMFFSIFNSFFFFFLSLIIVFGGPDDYMHYVFYFSAFIWILEALLKINTKIYKPFKAEYTRKKILKRYIKTRAFFDFIPTFVLLYSPSFQLESLYLKILLFIKMKNLVSDIYDLQKQLCMMFKNYFFIKLVNLIIQLFVIGHIIACVWYLLGLFEMTYLSEETTWYYEGLSDDLIWWKLYLAAMYWSLTLMTTGSNIATTVTQTTFTCIIMLFTTIIFGYLLNIIGIILSELDKQNETKNRDINLVNEYMRSKNISRTLKTRVNMDIEYYYSNNTSDYMEEDLQVLKKLPIELNDKLQREYSMQIISKIEFITQNFSSSLVDSLGFKMQEVQYFPNQTIYLEDDLNNPSLMYIISGEVTLQQRIAGDNDFQKVYKHVKKGETFGQESFLTGEPRQSTAITTKYTKIIKILRDDFLLLMDKQSKDYEVFCQMKDNILLYDNFKDINLMCNICSGYTHQEFNCPSVHFSKDLAYFKSSFQQRILQTRESYKRKITRINSLQYKTKICQSAKNYIDNQEQESLGTQQNLMSEECLDEQNNTFDEKQKQSQAYDHLMKKKSMHGDYTRRASLLKSQFSQNSNLIYSEQSPNQKENPEKPNSGFSGFAVKQSPFFEKLINENNKSEIQLFEKKNTTDSLHQAAEQTNQSIQEINPWLFEQLQEYIHYFPKGNSKIFFSKANKFIRKKLSQIIKRKKQK